VSDDRRARLDAIGGEILGHLPCSVAEICNEARNLVVGDGPADARVVLVGEAPGAREDATGHPFVGSAGRFLDSLLAEAGLTRDEVFITNVVKARPPKNRDPRADEVAHYRPWLERQLDVIGPDLIVPLGRHALAHFVPGVTITEAHGHVVEADGRRILPWFHPAAALHNQRLRETLLADARGLRDAL
jgi:uracil-DNA glycosylase family 4